MNAGRLMSSSGSNETLPTSVICSVLTEWTFQPYEQSNRSSLP